VSVIVPTLNEARRLVPCLEGLLRQEAPLLEVIVVDSHSADDTAALVADAARRDPRVRLAHDPPLPAGWTGKAWALQHGLSLARGEWVLGLDADAEPNDGCVAGVVAAAGKHGFDLVSFAPCLAGQSAAERFLQPTLLASLIYRTAAPGTVAPPERLLANGQCFLVRRSVFTEHGGYAPARDSFAEDVRLARHYARAGVRCGFLDGRLLFRVRSYRSAAEMWREWGRSIDLADATPWARQGADLVLLMLAQALPLPMLICALAFALPVSVVALNGLLFSVRLVVLLAMAPSYERTGFPFFASPLADPIAVLRVLLSTFRRRVTWRGRSYRRTP
jgi:dolichol-phosphate mannosyltransferase